MTSTAAANAALFFNAVVMESSPAGQSVHPLFDPSPTDMRVADSPAASRAVRSAIVQFTPQLRSLWMPVSSNVRLYAFRTPVM